MNAMPTESPALDEDDDRDKRPVLPREKIEAIITAIGNTPTAAKRSARSTAASVRKSLLLSIDRIVPGRWLDAAWSLDHGTGEGDAA